MGNKTDIKYLSPVDIELRQQNKYCRFKKMGIDYIDYKDPEFLMRFLNEQGKILPRRITGNSLKFQRRLAVSVKRARQIALLPYVADNLKYFKKINDVLSGDVEYPTEDWTEEEIGKAKRYMEILEEDEMYRDEMENDAVERTLGR